MNKQQIGEFVKQTREAQNMLQRELADKAKVRRQTVMDIENAANGYAVDKLLQVLDALSITISLTKPNDKSDVYIFKPKSKS